jgi:hypothetical protein
MTGVWQLAFNVRTSITDYSGTSISLWRWHQQTPQGHFLFQTTIAVPLQSQSSAGSASAGSIPEVRRQTSTIICQVFPHL